MEEKYIYSEIALDDFNPKFEVTSCFLEHDGKILLLLRQDHKPQPNVYWMPAGKIDSWETPLEAAMREISEETSIALCESKMIFITKLYVKYPTYDFIYYVYRNILEDLPDVKINPCEHKGFLWVAPLEALVLDSIPWLDECIKIVYF
ncbi:MAG: hypothetical protein ACD_2C00180G0005 [uncultured bacterium (gcode 4)]|uniref:Nudix hydrolase domain-containing protein n=1 Tax=uncultured bacterium (gcode 4) TaxID=1234023 RepID=K2G527_9BACT|nr:MAG: hypothetical protein ACD_2C00180G0005 [uncultured bacterium (gcode 4)]